MLSNLKIIIYNKNINIKPIIDIKFAIKTNNNLLDKDFPSSKLITLF